MRKITALAAVLAISLSTGCAQIKQASSSLDYQTGTYVSPETMNSFVKGKTRQNDVIAKVGHPPQKAEVSGKEVWTYTYTRLPMIPFQKNTFENTVFEFKRGVLVNAYKSGGTPGQSGNAMLDAAGM